MTVVKDRWEQIRASWKNLAPRERLLLSIVGVFGGLLALYFVALNPFLTAQSRASESALTADSQLAAMIRLRREYDTAQAQLAAVEDQIRGNQDRRNVLTLLEALAKESGVSVEAMKDRRAGSNEAYREQRVEVSLKKITLEQAVRYLHSIESAERPFSIKSLRMKKRADGSKLLDVTFAVSSFEPI